MEKFLKKAFLVAMFMTLNFSLCFAQSGDSYITHTVARGETLASIASRYAVTEAKIIELNPEASQFVYVGMDLKIPETNSGAAIVSTDDVNRSVGVNSDKKDNNVLSALVAPGEEHDDDNEGLRGTFIFGLTYTAASFDDMKHSGMYGLLIEGYFANITPQLGVGLHYEMNANYGLFKGAENLVYQLGPALAYRFTPSVLLSMPVCVVASTGTVIDDKGDEKSKIFWGMSFSPSLFIGHAGINFGPYFNLSLSGKSDLEVGFRVGLHIGL